MAATLCKVCLGEELRSVERLVVIKQKGSAETFLMRSLTVLVLAYRGFRILAVCAYDSKAPSHFKNPYF